MSTAWIYSRAEDGTIERRECVLDTVTITVTPEVQGWAKVLTERWLAQKDHKKLYMREYRKRKAAEKK